MTSRALRVGVLIGDSLVEEKVLDAARPITFGQSLRCALSVPVEGVPREHVLFACDQGSFVLRVTTDMDGRLGQRDAVATFDELRRTEPAADGTWAIALARGARGKLRIGDATILFQEIAKPAPTPRPQLPAAIRGTFVDRIDRRLAAIIGGSLAVHVVIAAWAWSSDVDAASLGMPPSVAQFQQATIDVSLPDRLVQPPAQPGAATPVAPSHAAPPIAHIPAHQIAPALRPPPPAMGTDDALRMASILSSDETAQRGVGGMNAHRPGSGLEKELEELQSGDHPITIGDDGRGARHTSTQIDRDPRKLPIDDPTRIELRPAKDPTEDPNHGRVKLDGAKSDDQTTLTAQVVLDVIDAQYIAGLQRCYRRGLSVDAQLSGKVGLSLTVGESGKVIDPEAAGADAQVDHCIQTLMGVWRFPIPHDTKGKPTEATFHVSLALQPS